jgi:hypothetical protein
MAWRSALAGYRIADSRKISLDCDRQPTRKSSFAAQDYEPESFPVFTASKAANGMGGTIQFYLRSTLIRPEGLASRAQRSEANIAMK